VLEREESNILKQFKFPNTYTMTKNLSEKALQRKRRPDLRLSITRPAMIGATQKYPFPGWTDSIAATSSIIYMLGMGISNRDMSNDVPGTFVPCDYCVNAILVATTVSAFMPKPEFTMFQLSGYKDNIINQTQFMAAAFDYLTY
jgi:hypothetical protein